MKSTYLTKTIARFAGVCLTGIITLTSVQLRAGVNYEPYTFISFAGSVQGSADGTGTAAQFFSPSGIASDSAGNIYVADFNNQTIRKITPAGVVTTLAGQVGVQGSANGTGSAAQFYWPTAVVPDTNGNVYVADTYNATIRKVTPGGVVTTFAGQAGAWGWGDGHSTNAFFAMPRGLTIDTSGNLYVADGLNHVIRKITPAGDVTTFAGSPGVQGSADGDGNAATFAGLFGLAIDAAGNIYAADYDNDNIRKITPAGHVTTLAGLAGVQGSDDGVGSAARFYAPWAVATDSSTNVYVTDGFNSTIRKITPAGVVTTLAGIPGVQGNANGTGSSATFNWPQGITTDSSGNLYVADFYNETVRKGLPTCPPISLSPATLPDGTVSVVAYNQNITANGGFGPYTYTVTAGSLPPGLALSAGGAISGTPSALGSFNFTIQAADTNGCTGTSSYSITVNCPTITLGPVTLPGGTLAAAYNQSITASGGEGSYSYAVTSGSLPTGLTLASDGTLAGLPIGLSTNIITVTATDTNGCTGSAVYTLAISPTGNPLDTNTPVVTITSPHNNAIFSNSPTVTVSGIARDTGGKTKTGVALVLYSLNGAAPQVAAFTSPSNWTTSVTLTPGWNTFSVQCLDYRGNPSATTNQTYYFGAPGFVTGTYQGLFCQTNIDGSPSINIQTAGTLTAAVNMQRVYSGKLYLNGTSYTIKGTFDLAGNSTTTISRATKSKPDLTANLHLDWTGVGKQITGTISCAGEGWTSSLTAIWTFKAQ